MAAFKKLQKLEPEPDSTLLRSSCTSSKLVGSQTLLSSSNSRWRLPGENSQGCQPLLSRLRSRQIATTLDLQTIFARRNQQLSIRSPKDHLHLKTSGFQSSRSQAAAITFRLLKAESPDRTEIKLFDSLPDKDLHLKYQIMSDNIEELKTQVAAMACQLSDREDRDAVGEARSFFSRQPKSRIAMELDAMSIAELEELKACIDEKIKEKSSRKYTTEKTQASHGTPVHGKLIIANLSKALKLESSQAEDVMSNDTVLVRKSTSSVGSAKKENECRKCLLNFTKLGVLSYSLAQTEQPKPAEKNSGLNFFKGNQSYSVVPKYSAGIIKRKLEKQEKVADKSIAFEKPPRIVNHVGSQFGELKTTKPKKAKGTLIGVSPLNSQLNSTLYNRSKVPETTQSVKLPSRSSMRSGRDCDESRGSTQNDIFLLTKEDGPNDDTNESDASLLEINRGIQRLTVGRIPF